MSVPDVASWILRVNSALSLIDIKKTINSTYMIYFWKQHRYSLWVLTKQFVKNRNIDSKQKENKFLRFSCQIELHDTHHNTSLVQSRHNHYEACTICIVFTSTVLIIHIHVGGRGITWFALKPRSNLKGNTATKRKFNTYTMNSFKSALHVPI